MIKRAWRHNWIAIAAAVVHGIWGIMLMVSDAPLHTTPLGHFPIKNHYVAGCVYFSASVLACVPILRRSLDTQFTGLACTIPQQFLLMVSAWTAIASVVQGKYPDGYVPVGGWGFILADQLWAISGTVFHTIALIDWYYFSRK